MPDDKDTWSVYANKIVRNSVAPRRKLCVPRSSDLPAGVALEMLAGKRETYATMLHRAETRVLADSFLAAGSFKLDRSWSGATVLS